MASVAFEEYDLMKDSKYRVYVSAVDKALKNFEYTSEWADLISALGKLNKVLLSHLKFPVIPRRIKISKRLAQCMHPALPSGVHLKALETYDIIFKCMGTNRLSHELFIYSAGLFPLLGHAAMNVRPSLLTVYETHFVPLGERLRPGLSGFLSGVLPGLEEGSDHFDRTNSLLEKVCNEVGPSHFYGCLWECLASNSSIRLPAISFVLSHFNKRHSMEDQLYVMGTNIDVMVNALCAGVQDTSVLVQRSALDLLLVGFPMHNSQLVRADMVRLVTAALVTILRRDMSLNRRLFAWLLGSEVNISLLSSEHPLVKKSKGTDISSSNLYFDMYSREMLIQAVKITLSQGVGETPHDLRPYRLLVSLLDKPDIGPVILDDILYEVFRTFYHQCESSDDNSGKGSGGNYNHKGSHELLKCANLLFSTLDPCYIWIYAGTLFDEACERQTTNNEKASPEHESLLKGEVKPVGSGPPNLLEVCSLTEFLLDTVSLETYMDTPSEHLPGLFLHVITQLTQCCDALLPQEVARSLQLCAKILSRVQPSALANQSDSAKILTVDYSEEKAQLSIQSDLTKSCSDVSAGVSEHSRVSELSESNKSNKDKSEAKKLASKMKKSYSAKFRTKHSKTPLSSYSVSSPVLLSVVKNDGGERSPVEDRRLEDITKSAETINTINTVITHLDRDSPEIGSRSAGPSLESGLNKVDTDLGMSEMPFNNSSIITCPPDIRIPSKQQTVLEQCLRQYEKFYVKFVGGQRVINGRKISELFEELLVVLPCETSEKKAAKLERLLYRCLNKDYSYEEDPIQTSPRCLSLKRNSHESWVRLKSVSVCQGDLWEEPMKVASSLLVELSTFPNYCLPGESSANSNEPMELSSFPEWLQVLVVCACWLNSVPALQLVAIGTLLDLISLLRSQCEMKGSSATGHQGVVAVVMVPLLKPWHVEYIERHTNVVPVLADSLWHHLGQLGSEHKVTCVELLHQLHNVLPNSEAVENVIGESLTEENMERRVDAFQRFALLWHIGREVETKAGMNRNFRTFDKSLLKMLDNLQLSESCPLKLQAQSWLLHSLLRGDISRILDPLLYMLLDPVTARMSVLHVSIEHSNTVHTRAMKDAENGNNSDENSATAKIYAISSVDGNVIYHVSDSTDQRKMKNRKEMRRGKISNPVRAKRIFAVTTLVGGGKRENHYITEKNTYVKELESALTLNRPQIQNISVFVNPFASTANNSCTSTDSAVEDEFGKNVTSPDCIRNATRFHQSSKVTEVGKEEKPADILDSNSRKDLNPDSAKSVSKFEAGNRRLKKGIGGGFEEGDECGDSSSDSNTNGGLEIVNGIVQRWSVGEDEVLGELEESTTAEEYFGTGTVSSGDSSSISVVEEILHDVLHMVVSQCSDNGNVKNDKQVFDVKSPGKQPMGVGVHQLHSHMLLYCGVYDSHRTLYALSCLRSILLTNARMFLCAAATTGLANVARSSGLLVLLARHRKSVFGRNFHGDITPSSGEFGATSRSSMYLEVLISVCLYFARSYYPNLGQMRLTQEEIAGNRQVQLASAELLMLICSELIFIVRDSGKGFACYIADLLLRCKVQKVVLHCVLSSVYNMRSIAASQEVNSVKSFSSDDHTQQRTFTEEIVFFNDPVTEGSENSNRCKYRGSDHSEGFQIQLLRLLLAVIMLEHQVNCQKGDSETTASSKESTPVSTMSKVSTNQLKYIAGNLIPQQPMFLSAVLSALKQDHMRHLHQHWTTLITSALPYMGMSLTHVVMSVVNQLCCNLEKLSVFYRSNSNSKTITPKMAQLCTPQASCCLPADYAVTQLEALTVLCHYCLLDSTQQLSHAFSQTGSGAIHMGIPGANPGQIFNNLIHVFMPTPLQQDPASKEKPGLHDSHITARRTVLSNMPRIIASVSALWQAVMTGNEWEQKSCVLGSPRIVKHHLLEFLSPISLHHGTNFLAAISVAWQERKEQSSSVPRKVVPVASTDQQVLVYLVGAIRVMPIDTVVQTVHQVVKQPPPIQGAKQDLYLEVSILELFYCYMQTCSGPQLAESWGSLIGLLRDGLTLTPPAQFLMLAILNEFVQKCPPLAEKKDVRDLQDITSKLVESCAQIAGACLEQTTWLRRNLAVREEEPAILPGTKEKEGAGTPGVSAAQYSVQAQAVLAELLAPLLDVSYGSQEKERVVALLTTLMYNITPYLKNHTRRNVPSFHACSQLLASLSSYQYTRKAWRRDVFDLLLDPALFQMEANCLPYWRTIIDNLMTHDNTTFRDLMSRVSLAQSGSLSIFSSREQEYEQRAQVLKRLAFVILCSETDQYHKHMPEIQERLADSLRLPQVVPSVQAQVFLCFRVLLLRMSPQHVTSLWPIIISELVQVFLHIEQELSTDTEEFRRNNSSHIRLLSALDSSWVVNSNNGLHAHGHPHWLQLQLAAAKLLDMAVLLPAHRLPQFQMYRWAFVGAAESTGPNSGHLEDGKPQSPDFVPHVKRITRLMDQQFSDSPPVLPRSPGQLLLTNPSIKTLQELHPFFKTLSVFSPSNSMADSGQGRYANMSELENVIERDFLEKLPTR